ncbi:CU044_5270 family protein [Actinocorallia aurantiaca]|uniref:CU044_5270 family protein n=1 Tax=Actinocorallia aurantiaca TaxID=46204 RepID=A0ABP6H9R3_9ACTN
MDDLETISDFYGPPPAAPPALERRIRTGFAARRRRPHLWPGLGAGLVAASAAAALLVSAGDDGSERTTPRTTATSRPVALDAQGILLAAASSSRKEPLTTGTYWRTRVMQGGHRVIPGKDYLVEHRQQTEFWRSTKDGMREYFVATDLGYRPLDQEAWRRDGSPKVWRFKLPDEVGDDYVIKHSPQVLRMAGGKERVQFYPGRSGLGQIAGEEITPKLLAALPTDGERLYKWITSRLNRLSAAAAPENRARPAEKAHLETNELFQLGVTLISQAPSSPELRAAAYEMLALIPTVEARGEVTDPLGRKGVAVALPGQATQYKIENGRMVPDGDRFDRLLIVDPATGKVLSTTSVITESELGPPGRLMDYDAFQDSGWEARVPAKFKHARPVV